ncbi:MAG: branched-chain amino acid aminotransferase [Sphaerochaeta sp.]|jgi:branched-chain amino acid aminotransferase|nr:branched-chain amino acid aminotransferase [Sphaerochaeta sp.]MCI2128153.1 branched-chain amino acid aminotransferase [Sphaerochaeta sp.]
MEKKAIDWANLGFSYIKTDYRYVSDWKDGAWDKGGLTKDADFMINECAGVLQYSQSCFEGLKAYTTEDGRTVTFRPDLNAKRLQDSCNRLLIPTFPEDRFMEALDQVVKANLSWVPPYGSGATLYVRPVMFGSGPVIGVAPAPEYQFRMFCTPVGPYFKGGVKPIRLMVSDYDRAAPHGTGHIKAGLNYAMSLYAGTLAHKLGFNENMFLDAATRTYIEETGGANFVFITKDGKLVTPKSPSILPSVTRRSIEYVAEHYLHMPVEERPVKFAELKDFAEAGVCGTAAVICPIGSVHTKDGDILLPSGMDHAGPYITKLYDTLTGIQMGRIEPPQGWIHEIK